MNLLQAFLNCTAILEQWSAKGLMLCISCWLTFQNLKITLQQQNKKCLEAFSECCQCNLAKLHVVSVTLNLGLFKLRRQKENYI